MITTKALATALEEWASTTFPGLNSLAAQPEQLAQALPLVICDITAKRRRRAGEGPKFQQFQQTSARIWQATLLVLAPPDPEWTAAQLLYDITDALEQAVVNDPTLGGRVPYAEPDTNASFVPAEVEHTDGTVARAATFTMSVAEQVNT